MKKKEKIMLAGIIAIAIAILAVSLALFFYIRNEKAEMAEKKQATESVKKEDKSETKKEEDKQEESEEEQVVVMETTTSVYFRKAPNKDSEYIKLLSPGTEVEKYSEENGWAKVKIGDDIGYISAEFLIDPAKKEEEPKDSKTEIIAGQRRDPNKKVVVIDPGHQRYGNSVKEPNGPGSSVMKARVTGGTTGRFTGVAEYILNLDVAMKLKTELQNRGYTVYMTRETHDIDISNMERAQYATTVGADIAVRIHANGSNNTSVQGAMTMAPSSGNPYVSHLASASYSLSKKIIDAYCAATGFQNDGVVLSDTMTGMNWSSVPVTIIEMGYMSNEHDDRAMQDANMQNNMVQGIANGIDAYFGL